MASVVPEDKKAILKPQAIELYKQGVSFRNIGKKLHLSNSTIRTWWNEYMGIDEKKPTKTICVPKYDRGRDEALYCAGWDDEQIADEFNISVEELNNQRNGKQETVECVKIN